MTYIIRCKQTAKIRKSGENSYVLKNINNILGILLAGCFFIAKFRAV